jgi:hypothetical protein
MTSKWYRDQCPTQSQKGGLFMQPLQAHHNRWWLPRNLVHLSSKAFLKMCQPSPWIIFRWAAKARPNHYTLLTRHLTSSILIEGCTDRSPWNSRDFQYRQRRFWHQQLVASQISHISNLFGHYRNSIITTSMLERGEVKALIGEVLAGCDRVAVLCFFRDHSQCLHDSSPSRLDCRE